MLDLVAPAVALDAGQAGVDDVADAGDRQRGFCHVGGQHDAAAPILRTRRFENAVLLLLAQAREQRQNFWRRAARQALLRLLLKMAPQVVCRFANFALTGQEDEDVARAFAPQLIDAVGNGVAQIKVTLFFKRPPALLDGEEPPRHGNDGRRPAC